MDGVYINGPGPDTAELRYSLRSLVNLPIVDRVWIVGTIPEWVRKVERLPLTPLPEKWANIRQSLTAACDMEDIGEEFVLLNDDHFVLKPVDGLPVWHVGTIGEYLDLKLSAGVSRTNTWMMGMIEMQAQMAEWGYGDPLCYEGHQPLLFDRRKLGKVLTDSTCRFVGGCVYAAAGAGEVGTLGASVKVSERSQSQLDEKLASGQPYLSTNEHSFGDGAVGRHVRALFPDTCDYERR